MDGRKTGDIFSVDVKNITQSWSYKEKCEICGKKTYDGVISVSLVSKKGDIVTVSIEGIRRND